MEFNNSKDYYRYFQNFLISINNSYDNTIYGQLFLNLLELKIEEKFEKYIQHKTNYKISSSEFLQIHELTENLIDNALNKSIDSGYIEMIVNSEGEMGYRLTQSAKDLL